MPITTDPSTQKFDAGQVVSISLGHAVHDTYTGFLPPLLPYLIETLSLSNTAAGVLNICLSASSLFQPLIGRLSDRADLSRIIVIAPIVTAVTMSLLGVAPGYAALVALLLVAGLSSAAFHSVAPVVAGRASGDNLGRGMGFWMLGGELGRVLGPLVVVSVMGWLTVHGLPWLIIPGVLAALVIWRFYSGGVEATPKAQPAPSGAWYEAFRGKGKELAPIIGMVFVRASIGVALGTFLPTFMTGEGSGLWLAGMALSLYQVAGVVGALLGGALSDRFGRRAVLLFHLVLSPALMAAFLLTEGTLQLVVLPFLGLATLCVIPVMMALVQETFPEDRALANGLYGGLALGARTLALLGLGALSDGMGMRTAFWVAALIPLVGIPLVRLMPGRTAQEA